MSRVLCAVFCLLPCLPLGAIVLSSDFSVTKTAPDPQPLPGNDVEFDVQVTNNGPDAGGVTMDDQIPAGLSFVSVTAPAGFSCTAPPVGATSGTVSCSAANMAASTNATITIFFHVPNTTPSNTTFDNTATVTSGSDPNSSNNSSTASIMTPIASDLSVLKTGPATASNDTDVSYTIVVTNNGPDAAAGVELKDAVNGGWTFVSVTAAPGFSCSDPGAGATSGMVDCLANTLAPNATATFTIVFHIPADAAPGTAFTNIATVSSQSDPNSENNSSTAVTTTPQPPMGDVFIVKSAPSAAPPDSDVTYTITVTNSGPNTAQNVSFMDSLPDSVPTGHAMTFVSFTQTGGPTFNCGAPGTTVNCTIATLNAGVTATFEYTGHIPSGTPTGAQYSNVVAVSSDNDPNAENNTSGTAVTVSSADLGVVKSGPVTAVVAGGPTFDYIVTLSNSGPDAATDAAFTDQLPSGVAFVNLVQNTGPAASCNAGSTVFCSIPALGNGQTAQFTITVQPLASNANGSILGNTAFATSSSFDSNANNNNSTANVTVTTSADVSIVKTGPATNTAGTPITYTITVANAGPSDAQNVSFTDTLPAGATFVSVNQTTGPTFNCTAGGVCSIATLASGASATFSYTINSSAAAANGSTFTNTAVVSSTTSDANAGNNTSTTAPATVAASADINIVKGAPASVAAGTNLTYSISFANLGPSDAQNVTITDVLPPNTTFVSVNGVGAACTGPAVGSPGAVTCTRATLPATANGSVTIIVHVASSATGTIGNTATIGSSTSDPNTTNNTSATTTNVTTSADLSIVKNGPAAAPPGNDVTYTIAVANAGPSDAQSVVVSDVLPASTTFVSITAAGYSCTTPAVGSAGTVTCTMATLPATGSAPITLVVHTVTAATGTINNTATVNSATADPNAANNSSTTPLIIGVLADVSVTKVAATPANNTEIAFDVTVSNAGPGDALSVTMTDAVPAGTTFVSESQTAGPTFTCTTPAAGAATGTISCSIASLIAGSAATFRLVFAPVVINAAPISNTANVTATTPDPNAANNTAMASSFPAAAVPASTPLVLALLALSLAGIATTVLRH